MRSRTCQNPELEAIKEARDLCIHEGIPIEETLDGDLLINLKNRFSFAESNYAEITAVARDATGEIKVAKTITREVNARQRTIYADRPRKPFPFGKPDTTSPNQTSYHRT